MSRDLRARWRSAVLSDAGPATAPARLVAVALAEYMDAAGRGAYPSERRLAEVTALPRRRVHQALEQLDAAGWVTVRDTGRRGRFGVPVREYGAAIPGTRNGAAPEPMGSCGNGSLQAPMQRGAIGAVRVPMGGVANGAERPAQWCNSPPAMVHFEGSNGARTAPDPEEPAREPVREGGARPREELTPERESLARQLAPGCNAATEWEKFQDYYRAHGRQLADLDAAWRSWLRKVQHFDGRPPRATAPAVAPRITEPPSAEAIRQAQLEAIEANRRQLARLPGGLA